MKKSVIYEIIDEILDEYEGGNNKVDKLIQAMRGIDPNYRELAEAVGVVLKEYGTHNYRDFFKVLQDELRKTDED